MFGSAEMLRRLHENVEGIRRRIDRACERSGRSPDSVTLIAVTKYARIEWVRGLLELGLRDLGESRPQQLLERADLLAADYDVHWHLIGHLQRNKARRTLPSIARIHSVDTLRLLQTLERLADELNIRPRVLLEVNVSGEAAKDGFAIPELEAVWTDICRLRLVEITGLMTMAPHSIEPESARPVFRRLRELRDELVARNGDGPVLTELSMGMSGDFEIGIEEGATHIRIGSALYDGLSAGDE